MLFVSGTFCGNVLTNERKILIYLFQVLAQNSGYDPQETLLKLQTEYKESGQLVGVDLSTGLNLCTPTHTHIHMYTWVDISYA